MSSKYLLKSACKKITKQGKPYFDVTLCTKDGDISGKYWSGTPDMMELLGNVIEVDGSIGEFNGEPQITIQTFALTDDAPELYCRHTKCDIDQMFLNVERLIDSCKNMEIKSMLEKIFGEYEDEFKKHAGALKVHHAFVGGLLQHTICVATCASKMCEVYKKADRDIVIAAALLHDIGKLKELSNFPSLQYTRLGSCVGHITLSVMEVSKYLDMITDELVRDKLLNCIASHHGRLEWGSPVVPACIEAIIVHVSDLLDAKVEIILEASENLDTGEMSGYINTLGCAAIGV